MKSKRVSSFVSFIMALIFFGAFTMIAISPDGAYAESWGYIQKALTIALIILSFNAALHFGDAFVNSFGKAKDDVDAQLDRACRNPRIPSAPQRDRSL